jgi:gluconate 2-dehydrogenase alpha chain
MAKKPPPVDALLVGFGWTGAILAQELTDAGLNVLALERGGWRDTATDFATTFIQDELRYYYRYELFQEPARETLTFRNSVNDTALPMRHLGSFLPASGVGGAGIHWNGQNWRFLPTDFTVRTHTMQRYGAQKIPQNAQAAKELGLNPFPAPSANMAPGKTQRLQCGEWSALARDNW